MQFHIGLICGLSPLSQRAPLGFSTPIPFPSPPFQAPNTPRGGLSGASAPDWPSQHRSGVELLSAISARKGTLLGSGSLCCLGSSESLISVIGASQNLQTSVRAVASFRHGDHLLQRYQVVCCCTVQLLDAACFTPGRKPWPHPDARQGHSHLQISAEREAIIFACGLQQDLV